MTWYWVGTVTVVDWWGSGRQWEGLSHSKPLRSSEPHACPSPCFEGWRGVLMPLDVGTGGRETQGSKEARDGGKRTGEEKFFKG